MLVSLTQFWSLESYLVVNHREDNEREEVLDTEDQESEGVLHVLVRPDLNTHGVVSPGQGDCLNGLEDQDR